MFLFRYISIILVFIFIFTVLKTSASETLINKNNFTKDSFKIQKNEKFKCFKLSRKYISGQKTLVFGFGNLKFNILNFDGYRQVNQYKCLMK